jgi:hypothetical protein
VQLLVSSIEEAAKYAALAAAPCNVPGAQLPSWQYARNGLVVVAVAVAVCSLVEVLYLSAYALFVEAPASMGIREPAPCSDSTSCSKAKPDHKHID